MIFVPLNKLTESEIKFLPGNVDYTLNPPPFIGRTQSGAIDVLNEYPIVPEMDPPNVSGYRYYYDEALAAALKDIEGHLIEGLNKLEGNYRNRVKNLKVYVKDGGDGLGDMKEMRNRGTLYPSKVVRMAFTILSVTAVLDDNQEIKIFVEEKPNSEMCCRPLVVALADEQDKRSLAIMCKPLMFEREALQSTTMTIGSLSFTFSIYGTMYDEKMLRMGEGMLSSGSKYFCTLCTKLRTAPIDDVMDITRTHENCIYNFEAYERNAQHLTRENLLKESTGIASKPFLSSDPMIDATHADIHWGEKVFEMYAREIAQVYDPNKELTQEDKALVKDGAVRLKKFCREELGLKKELMMVGNFAREMLKPKTVQTLCDMLLPPQRHNAVKQYIALLSQMRTIYRATNPEIGSVDTYRELSSTFKTLLTNEFKYAFPLSNYQHKVLDHVPDLIIQFGSVGKFSTEPVEAGNKLCRRFRKCNAYKSPTMEMLHILKYHWLYTMKSLQMLVRDKANFHCGFCRELGHTARTCAKKTNSSLSN
ncbi:V(D)J recombination-activating protein 1-like [Amphiura filiformis]|uniref:V(D)J recombination-activating protein 1-like n=1 Tax=Amphiura filiformis TaxID=82378 RepID=UPI003B20EB41